MPGSGGAIGRRLKWAADEIQRFRSSQSSLATLFFRHGVFGSTGYLGNVREIKMNLVSWEVRRLTYLLLIIFAFGVDAARAANSPQICNKTNILVEVAIAWWGSDLPGLHSKGWYSLQPGECKYPFPADSYPAHRYYFAYNDAADLPDPTLRYQLTRVWSSDTYEGGQLTVFTNGYCVADDPSVSAPPAFEFADAHDLCSPPNLRRGFVHIEEGADNLGFSGTGEDFGR